MNEHMPIGDLLEAERVPAADPQCRQCGEAFTPRGPGRKQVFCNTACRRAYHDRPDSLEGPAVKRANDDTFENENSGEGLLNPPAERGSFIDHTGNGGPRLHIPESELKHVDRIGRELAAEEAAADRQSKPRFPVGCFTILPAQPEIRMERLEDGSVLLTEIDGAGNETSIYIAAENAGTFIDRLTDEWGIPRYGG